MDGDVVCGMVLETPVGDRAGTVREGGRRRLKGRVGHGCLTYTQKHAVAVELCWSIARGYLNEVYCLRGNRRGSAFTAEMMSEKPNDLSARLGQPSSRQADEHNGLGGIGVPMDVDGCVWCQPSSGSETTCERPNQAAQVVRGSNAGGAVQVWGPLSAAIQASPGRAQRGPGLGAGAQAAGWP